MRRQAIAIVGIALLFLTASGLAVQTTRAVGQVRSRGGAPLANCQLDFFLGDGQKPVYRAYTDRGGSFFIENPRNGKYSVVVIQGGRSARLVVSISGSKLDPAVLHVPW